MKKDIVAATAAVKKWFAWQVESFKWAVRDWSTAHPPASYWLIRELDLDESTEFGRTTAFRTARTRAEQDRAAADWLIARGQGHRVPAAMQSTKEN